MTRWLFLPAVACLSWLLMQVVHEAGHVLAAWGTGGTVVAVTLHPLAISETVVRPNLAPLVVVWAGPIAGVAIPLALWGLSRWLWKDSAWLFQFFAGFCLIANGAYLGSGVVDPVGDAFDLIQLGTPRWVLGVFGLVAVPCGIWMWDGLPPRFGLGANGVSPTRRQFWGVVLLLAAVIVGELLATGWRGESRDVSARRQPPYLQGTASRSATARIGVKNRADEVRQTSIGRVHPRQSDAGVPVIC